MGHFFFRTIINVNNSVKNSYFFMSSISICKECKRFLREKNICYNYSIWPPLAQLHRTIWGKITLWRYIIHIDFGFFYMKTYYSIILVYIKDKIIILTKKNMNNISSKYNMSPKFIESKSKWPPWSPDFNAYNFFLWEY